jgi:hypothetical protein
MAEAQTKAAVTEGLGRAAAGIAGTAKPWLLAYTRFGFAAKGAVQLLIGALALAAAVGDRQGKVTDAAGALRAVAREPFGRPVLLLVAAGLVGYASFKLLQGVLDPENRPPGWRTRLFRVADTFSGVLYLLLAIGTVRLFLGLGAPISGDARSRFWTGEALAVPHGDLLLMLGAFVLGAIACLFLARALIVRDVCADLRVDELGPSNCRAAGALIRVASLVQASLFGTVATLLYRAAEVRDPAQVSGTGGALRLLGAQHGRLALALLAVGMLAMGLSSFVEARWRKLP